MCIFKFIPYRILLTVLLASRELSCQWEQRTKLVWALCRTQPTMDCVKSGAKVQTKNEIFLRSYKNLLSICSFSAICACKFKSTMANPFLLCWRMNGSMMEKILPEPGVPTTHVPRNGLTMFTHPRTWWNPNVSCICHLPSAGQEQSM